MFKHDDEYYRQRKPKPDLGLINNFKRFLWDPVRRTFLDRTREEWINVGIFYLCFYGVLFSISALQMYITYKNITMRDKPYFQYNRIAMRAWLEPNRQSTYRMANLHGPGIVMKPNIIKNSNPPLILIDETTETGKYSNYVKAIKTTFSEYKVNQSKYDANCNEQILRYENAKTCYFDVQSLGQCSQEPYGYTPASLQPCVYIKFNKRIGWLPIFYSHASLLPDNMPEWLQKLIKATDQFHVWLSCEGKSEEDTASIGNIEYLPRPGFPVQYFPFAGQVDYLSPVVALRFKNLPGGFFTMLSLSIREPFNQMVTIECKTWAHNIDNENRYNLNFRILIKQLK